MPKETIMPFKVSMAICESLMLLIALEAFKLLALTGAPWVCPHNWAHGVIK